MSPIRHPVSLMVERIDAERQRTVVGFSADYPAGHLLDWHRHRRTQLLYAQTGTMRIRTEGGAWMVPPGLALWMPGGTWHEVSALSAIGMRTIYMEPEIAGVEDCDVIEISPLVRELIMEIVRLGEEYQPDGPGGRVADVLIDQLRELKAAPLHLPLPRDRRLLRITDALGSSPGDTRPLAAWADIVGATERTIARRFRAETGLSFGAWRGRNRLLSALQRLAEGDSITSVALDLGYSNPSAFIAMFRRQLGASPTQFLARQANGAAGGN